MKEHYLINSTHLNIGKKDNEVAFLFSCPGQMEEDLKKPVACQTGVNLNILLSFLNSKQANVFKYINRYEYRITNSWNQVEFKERTNRTEATLKEIKDKDNIERIKKELVGINVLILFGEKAQNIIDDLNLKKDVIVIKSRHLSFQSLNQIKKDIEDNDLKKGVTENTKKRLEVVATDILNNYNKTLERNNLP